MHRIFAATCGNDQIGEPVSVDIFEHGVIDIGRGLGIFALVTGKIRPDLDDFAHQRRAAAEAVRSPYPQHQAVAEFGPDRERAGHGPGAGEQGELVTGLDATSASGQDFDLATEFDVSDDMQGIALCDVEQDQSRDERVLAEHARKFKRAAGIEVGRANWGQDSVVVGQNALQHDFAARVDVKSARTKHAECPIEPQPRTRSGNQRSTCIDVAAAVND